MAGLHVVTVPCVVAWWSPSRTPQNEPFMAARLEASLDHHLGLPVRATRG